MIALSRLVALFGVCLAALPAVPGWAGEARIDRLIGELAAVEAKDGNASPDLLPAIARLAEARRRDGALDAAAALRRRALTIALAAFGCDSPQAAKAMAALALLDIDRRRYLDAEPLLIIADRVLSRRADDNDASRGPIFAGLARIAQGRGDTRSAEAWATRAVALARRDPESSSTEPLRALGAALTAEKRFDTAERVLRAALAQDRSRSGGAGALATARSLSQLANLYLRWDRASEALPLIEQATAIDQAQLGPTHPLIADDLHDLGLVYAALKRNDMARRAFEDAIGVLERGCGRDTPRVAYAELELSRLYRLRGDKAAAEAAFRDARRILNKAEAEEQRRERDA